MSVGQSEFQNATSLRDSGRWDEAASAFHHLASQAESRSEKAALLINEHRCYCDAGRLDEAEKILHEIRELEPLEPSVRVIIDFGEACMSVQAGRTKQGLNQFDGILHRYPELSRGADRRGLYENIQKRRGVALADLVEYAKAIPILEESTSSKDLTREDKQEVHFYLGLCYEKTQRSSAAKVEYLRAVDLLLKNDFEAHARYSVARLYFNERAFAQAKYQLEMILQLQQTEIPNLPKHYVFEQLSRACHYLGDEESAERYHRLGESSRTEMRS
jgi:pentatricopeptide repeat protein